MQKQMIIIGSQTKAIRAQRVLKNAGYTTELIKATGGVTPRGCQYALRIDAGKLFPALRILESENISYIDYGGA